jgi:hypothetical protein
LLAILPTSYRWILVGLDRPFSHLYACLLVSLHLHPASAASLLPLPVRCGRSRIGSVGATSGTVARRRPHSPAGRRAHRSADRPGDRCPGSVRAESATVPTVAPPSFTSRPAVVTVARRRQHSPAGRRGHRSAGRPGDRCPGSVGATSGTVARRRPHSPAGRRAHRSADRPREPPGVSRRHVGHRRRPPPSFTSRPAVVGHPTRPPHPIAGRKPIRREPL